MTGDDTLSRRGTLRVGAVAGLSVVVAGCPNGGDGADVDRDAWADVDGIVLEAYTQGWEGVAPDPIEGETNPTLGLEGGRANDVTWENADGAPTTPHFATPTARCSRRPTTCPTRGSG